MKQTHYKVPALQDLLNVYPAWSRIRQDHQSLGAQVLNSLGLAIEDLRVQTNRELSNNWLQQYDCLALDQISEIDISDFDLTYISDHPGEAVLQISASGLQNGTWYNVELADPNSLESLYYDFIPTRISKYSQTNSGTFIVVNSNIFTVTSGVASYNSFKSLDKTLPFNNRLYVTITDGQVFYSRQDGRQCKVTIKGKDRNDVEISEIIKFAFNDTRISTHIYSYVDEIDVTGLRISDYDLESSSPATIRVTAAAMSSDDRPLMDPNSLTYTQDREISKLLWDITDSTTASGTCLQQYQYETGDIQVLHAGYQDLTLMRETLMRNTTSSGISITDIALNRGRYWLWAVSSGLNKLYCYDLRDLSWPDFGEMRKRKYDSYCRIETTQDIIKPGDSISIDSVLVINAVEPAKARLLHKTPSGNTYMVINNADHTYDKDYWTYRDESINNDPSRITLVPTATMTLSEVGTHLFTLEVEYNDGTKDYDERFVIVDAIDASAEFDLSSIVSGVAVGIDFDIDGRLWVRDSGGVYYALTLHNDRFIVDESNKYAYFFEDYSEVKLT